MQFKLTLVYSLYVLDTFVIAELVVVSDHFPFPLPFNVAHIATAPTMMTIFCKNQVYQFGFGGWSGSQCSKPSTQKPDSGDGYARSKRFHTSPEITSVTKKNPRRYTRKKTICGLIKS